MTSDFASFHFLLLVHEEGKGWNEKIYLKVSTHQSSQNVLPNRLLVYTLWEEWNVFSVLSQQSWFVKFAPSPEMCFSPQTHNWKTDAAVQWILPEFSSFENNAARCSRSRAFQNGCTRREGTRKTGGVPYTRNGGRFVRPQITTKIGSVLANRSWLIMLFIIQLHKVEYSWRANRAQTRLFGRLVYSKKNLFNQSGARATLLYPLCFSHLMRND